MGQEEGEVCCLSPYSRPRSRRSRTSAPSRATCNPGFKALRLSGILPVFRGRAEGLVVAPSRPPRGVPSLLMTRRCYQIALPCVFARTIGERPEVVSPRLASSGGPLCGSHSPQIQDSSQTRSRSVCRPMRTVQQATELCVSARKTPFVMTGQSQCARPRRDLAVGCSPPLARDWFGVVLTA